jgi:hypothetical protein
MRLFATTGERRFSAKQEVCMLPKSIRLVTLAAVFAFASRAASIGVEGTNCGGDPLLTSTVFSITTDSGGDFCLGFTNGLGGPVGGPSPSITELTFQSDLAAGILATDYTCTTDLFRNCGVTVDPDANSLTVSFFSNVIRDEDIGGSGGIAPGGQFWIVLNDFAPSQTLEVDVNGATSPEPGTLLLLLAVGPLWILRRLLRN